MDELTVNANTDAVAHTLLMAHRARAASSPLCLTGWAPGGKEEAVITSRRERERVRASMRATTTTKPMRSETDVVERRLTKMRRNIAMAVGQWQGRHQVLH